MSSQAKRIYTSTHAKLENNHRAVNSWDLRSVRRPHTSQRQCAAIADFMFVLSVTRRLVQFSLATASSQIGGFPRRPHAYSNSQLMAIDSLRRAQLASSLPDEATADRVLSVNASRFLAIADPTQIERRPVTRWNQLGLRLVDGFRAP